MKKNYEQTSLKRSGSQSHNYERLSALIVAIFVFLYGLVLPISSIVPVSLSISIITLGLVGYALVSNRICFSMKTFWLIAIPLAMLILKMPFEYVVSAKEGYVVQRMLIGFLTAGISGILIGTIQFRAEDFLEMGYKVAWLNFVLIAFIPFTALYKLGEETAVNYMRYGYAMLPIVLLSYSMLQKGKKKIGVWILFIASFSLMFIFGARGAFVTFLLFVGVLFLLHNEISIERKALTIFLLALVVAYLPSLLNMLVQLLDSWQISSYAVSKYSEAIIGDSFAESSSGRDILYGKAIDRIINFHPLGDPINSCYVDTGSFAYYHNIVLDLLVNYGIYISSILLILALILTRQIIRRSSQNDILVFMLLLMIPMGRLFLSSSFWLRPDFWFFVSYAIGLMSRVIKTSPKSVSR